MGKLRNFERINWKPFKKRIGNIEVSNFYINDEGIPKPNQGHLTDSFNYFSVDKYYPNEYYGNEDKYEFDETTNSYKNGTFSSIHASCFKYPESKFMVAMWVDINHDEKVPDLKFVGNRPMDLNEQEFKDFWECVKIGQKHIESVLEDFDEYE